MGPVCQNPEDLRPYFAETRDTYNKIKSQVSVGTEFTYLSMGMSGSYRIALEEGANIVRIGTKIFE